MNEKSFERKGDHQKYLSTSKASKYHINGRGASQKSLAENLQQILPGSRDFLPFLGFPI